MKKLKQVQQLLGGPASEVQPRNPPHVVERDAYDVKEWCTRNGIGRTLAYELMKDGTLRSYLLHGRRVIPATESIDLYERLAAKAGAK